MSTATFYRRDMATSADASLPEIMERVSDMEADIELAMERIDRHTPHPTWNPTIGIVLLLLLLAAVTWPPLPRQPETRRVWWNECNGLLNIYGTRC